MRTTALENAALAIAALALGLMAAFFATYTINLSLALRLVDGATYATVQSLLNQSVHHPIFGALYFSGVGAPALLAFALTLAALTLRASTAGGAEEDLAQARVAYE